MRPSALALSILMALSLVACGGGDNGDGDDPDAAANGGPDAGETVADAGDGAADAAVFDAVPPDAEPEPCTTLANDAPAINLARSTSPRPDPLGGTIQDGTYYLVEDVFYGSDTDEILASIQSTSRITGDSIEIVFASQGGQPTTQTETYSATGDPTRIEITQLCPTETTGEREYTATADTFVLHIRAGLGDVYRVRTWERQ